MGLREAGDLGGQGDRRVRLVVAILFSVVLVEACGVEAGARPNSFPSAASSNASQQTVVKTREYARFIVAGTNGYRILVSTALGDFGAVHVIVYRRHSAVEYLAFESRASAEGIEANLNGLGRISVRFHPRARSRRTALGLPPKCSLVARPMVRRGVFSGTIAFHGEGGFTTVDRVRARGDAGTVTTKCPPFHLFKAPEPSTAVPEIVARIHGGEFYAGSGVISPREVETVDNPDLVRALRLGRLGKGPIDFEAESREGRKTLAITRVAVARGPSSSMDLDDTTRTARIKPPLPFSGEATITGCPRNWRGTLSAHFPGRIMHLPQRAMRHSAAVFSSAFFECGR